MTNVGIIAVLGLVSSGCAGAAAGNALFDADQPRDAGIAIAKVEERLRHEPRPPGVPVAVGVTESGLVGAMLPRGAVWHHAGKVDSLPEVTVPGVVIGTGGGHAFALDGATGKVLFEVKSGGYLLRGAADDGRHAVLSLGEPGKDRSRLLAVAHDGKVLIDVETDVALGRPALLAGVAFVPWGGQYVSAIELETGQELGRALVRELVTHAMDLDGALYFGQQALVRFDEKIRYAESFQATRFVFAPRELPGKPVWLASGLDLSRVDRTALPKIRVFAAPAPQGAGLASGSYAATYFRIVYGFAAGDGHLLWADALPADALAGAAAASGFAFCDAAGGVHLYDPAGRAAKPAALGERLVACRVGVSTLHVEATTDRGTVPAQIEHGIGQVDSNMAAAEGLLIAELGKLEDPAVTGILIGFSESSRLPPDQRRAARTLLAGRRSGADVMLAALARHYDFISDEQPPPVGPLADALAALGETRAAPLLARHLNDPATALEDVERAAHALEALSTPAELPALRTFFALYRSTADEPSMVGAVLSVAKALLRLGGVEGRALVQRATTDPMTQPEVARGVSSLLAGAKG